MGHKFDQSLQAGNKHIGSTDNAYTNAIEIWGNWRENNCTGTNQANTDLTAQQGILLANNLLYNEMKAEAGGTVWAVPKDGVPKVIADWIAAANAPNSSAAIQFAGDWVNQVSVWAQNTLSGKMTGTFFSQQSVQQILNRTSVQITYTPMADKYRPGAAGKTGTAPWNMSVMAYSLPKAWSFMVGNASDQLQLIASQFVETGLPGGTNPGLPRYSGTATPPSLYPSDLMPLTPSSPGPPYKYYETQALMTAVLEFCFLVWILYCSNSGEYWNATPGGGGNGANCSATCSKEGGSSTQCTILSNGKCYPCKCTKTPVDPTACGKNTNSHIDPDTGTCVCDHGYNWNASAGQCQKHYKPTQPCQKHYHRDSKGKCVPDSGTSCPKGQHKNASGACVPNTPSSGSGFPLMDLGIAAAVLSTIVGGVIYYNY